RRSRLGVAVTAASATGRALLPTSTSASRAHRTKVMDEGRELGTGGPVREERDRAADVVVDEAVVEAEAAGADHALVHRAEDSLVELGRRQAGDADVGGAAVRMVAVGGAVHDVGVDVDGPVAGGVARQLRMSAGDALDDLELLGDRLQVVEDPRRQVPGDRLG